MSYLFTQNQLSRSLTPPVEITVQSIDFQNKKVVFIKYNGEIDTTFDVSAPDATTLFELTSNPESDTFTIEKKCLFGDNMNLKLSVLVNQVAKLLYGKGESRNLVLSLSSKLFKVGESISDFDVIILILQLLSELITQ